MSASTTLLEQLRYRTTVDCDTLDPNIAQSLGPFEDCTSNQIIAYNELQNKQHESLLEKSAALAFKVREEFPKVNLQELAVEISLVNLSLLMLPNVRGLVHVQTNPRYSDSVTETIQSAQRILKLTETISSSVGVASRICIKIPSTWEGLQACRVLEKEGVSTLATTLFTKAQAILAGEVGCRYIAPYVYELKVQVEQGQKDDFPLFDLCVGAQTHYNAYQHRTKVLPASLVCAEDAMRLAGVQHITIAPHILQELATTKFDPDLRVTNSLFDGPFSGERWSISSFADNVEAFRTALSQEDEGMGEKRLKQAIDYFIQAQDRLEAMLKPFLKREP